MYSYKATNGDCGRIWPTNDINPANIKLVRNKKRERERKIKDSRKK